jgi:gluconate 2-dehydrogenase gamma chain
MDRRKSIKALVIGTVATGVVAQACKSSDDKKLAADAEALLADRMQEEKDHLKKVEAEPEFFTAHEMATITVLSDIIVPKDAISGSATEAKVPEFIAFIVKDMPDHQTPMRGGLRWLDMQCFKQFDKAFVDCTAAEQIKMVDQIAYPEKADPKNKQGVTFFNLMRDLTLTGFYTSEMGVKDLGYAGNVPNKWNGVPAEVLKEKGLAYTDKENKECVSYS